MAEHGPSGVGQAVPVSCPTEAVAAGVSAPVGRVRVGADHRVVEANLAAASLLGLPLERLLAMQDQEFAPHGWEELGPDFFDLLLARLSEPLTTEALFRRPDGWLVRARLLLQPLPEGGYTAELGRLGAPAPPPSPATTAASLAAWRAAQRRADAAERWTVEWMLATAEVAVCRRAYRDSVEAVEAGLRENATE